MKIRIPEYRSTLKSLYEQRNDKVAEMESLINAAKGETRAMTDEEQIKFTDLEKEITDIDATISAEERSRNISGNKPKEPGKGQTEEVRANFDAFLRGQKSLEQRADAQSTTLNENIIPSEFSTDIIRKVVESSGIFSSVTRVNSKGIYKQIIEKNKISAGWTSELAEVTKTTADFDIVEIGHKKLGALVKLSLEIINQAEFDIISEVTTQMIADFALKAEQALINGNGTDRPLGLMSGGTDFPMASPSEITADEMIRINGALKAPFVPGARWLMSRKSLTEVRLLKDNNNRYLFNDEITNDFVGRILGKPVLISEAMPDYQFLYGDFRRAYKANVNPGMTIQRLNELYSTQGAVGILGFVWFDGRPINNEAYIKAKGE